MNDTLSWQVRRFSLSATLWRVMCIVISMGFATTLQAQSEPANESSETSAALSTLGAFEVTIPRTTLSIEFVPLHDKSDANAATIWLSSKEIDWDAYDTFVFGLDIPFGEELDASVRPSKPYMFADYGFGRSGFPVISVSAQGAQAFCTWLSERTGLRFRLPTETEWERAAQTSGPAWLHSERRRDLRTHAWLAPSARQRTHARGALPADSAGLHDLFGNAAEWCLDAEGKPVLKGGSFQTELDAFELDWRDEPTRAWNQRDPQIPKSPWWLSDAPFAGFRILCEAPPAEDSTSDSASSEDNQ